MANLQIKGIDDALYKDIKLMAHEESRSVSQQVLYLIRHYLAMAKKTRQIKTPAQALLELSGSWEDARQPEQIIKAIKTGRKNSQKLSRGF